MSFCSQNKKSFDDLNSNGGGSESESNGGGCGCDSGGVKYEPLTKDWFRQNAGIIALAVTLIMIIARSN